MVKKIQIKSNKFVIIQKHDTQKFLNVILKYSECEVGEFAILKNIDL